MEFATATTPLITVISVLVNPISVFNYVDTTGNLLAKPRGDS